MFSDADWCRRIGLIWKPTYSPEYIALVKLLVTWRTGLTGDGRRLWFDIVDSNAREYNRMGKAIANEDWHALSQKKSGLFGGAMSTALSPINGYRHPWVMSNAEFTEVYNRLQRDIQPQGSIPETRWRVPTEVAKAYGLISTALGGLSTLTGGAVKLIPGPIGIFAQISAALSGAQSGFDWLEQQRFDYEYPHLKPFYEFERKFRVSGL